MARHKARENAACDRRLPFYVEIEVPVRGLGERVDQINAWLDDNSLEGRAGPRGPRRVRLCFSEYETAAAFARSFGFEV